MQIRIARPVTDLARSQKLYSAGLELTVLGSFTDHAGFDGVMLGRPGLPYHFEFTLWREHPVLPQPTPDDLLVCYLPDASVWRASCARMLLAGFRAVDPFNPYWAVRGKTFEDLDGYRTVLQNAEWNPSVPKARPDA